MISWFKKKLGIDSQNEKITELISLVQEIKENKSVNSNSVSSIDKKITELISFVQHSKATEDSISSINKDQLQIIRDKIDEIAIEVLPKKISYEYKLVNPIQTSKTIFSFEKNNDLTISKKKTSVNADLFLQNLGSTIPELVSNGLLMQSYRFVFPQGVSGTIMQMANGQGTAIMQGGKIVGHGAYVSNFLVGAPLLAVSIGSMVIRQHYLAKINDNLNKINLKVSQLLELEFIKKHSKVESIIYFLEKAHYEFSFIENNKEYRSAILTNLVKTNIEILELIQFYEKSFKFVEKSDKSQNEIVLNYYLALHKLYVQGKLLEFKYAMEYSENLILNLKFSFKTLNDQSINFLKQNQIKLSGTIQIKNSEKSSFDWILRKKAQKEENIKGLSDTKEIISQIIEIQTEEIRIVTNELDEFKKNITKKQEFIIENGELYEVLE